MDNDIIFKITSSPIIYYANLLLFSECQVGHIGGQNSRQVNQSKNRLIDNDDDQCQYDILN
jgi:hypothetical protein